MVSFLPVVRTFEVGVYKTAILSEGDRGFTSPRSSTVESCSDLLKAPVAGIAMRFVRKTAAIVEGKRGHRLTAFHGLQSLRNVDANEVVRVPKGYAPVWLWNVLLRWGRFEVRLSRQVFFLLLQTNKSAVPLRHFQLLLSWPPFDHGFRDRLYDVLDGPVSHNWGARSSAFIKTLFFVT